MNDRVFFYATKAHGIWPTVWCGERGGPNVREVRRTRTMLGARFRAWILNTGRKW